MIVHKTKRSRVETNLSISVRSSFASEHQNSTGILNKDSFEAFYKSTSRPMWLYIYRMCGDESLADEIFQESFLRFFRKAPLEMNDFQKKAYLYRTASRLLIDKKRRIKVEENAFKEYGLDLPTGGNRNILIDLEKTFNFLKPKERILLWLIYVEGYEHREAGKILGLKEKSIKVLLFRLRKKTASHLEKIGYSPEG